MRYRHCATRLPGAIPARLTVARCLDSTSTTARKSGLKLTPASADILRSRSIQSYRGPRSEDAWDLDSVIDWDAPSRLPEDLLQRAWYITSQGSHAEQIGMLTAAELMDQTDDYGTRVCLAAAVADEGKHSEVLARYAVRLAGSVQAPGEHVDGIFSAFAECDDFLGRFTIHTMLEGFAADEFGIFVRIFRGDPLSTIYDHLRRDELRHVGMGLEYLSRKLETPEAWEAFDLDRYEQLGLRATGITPESFGWLAELDGTSPVELSSWFMSRHEARMKRLKAPTLQLGKESNR